MPKLSPEDLKELFDIVSDIKPVRLDFCLSAAERTLRQIVTDAVYSASSPVRQVESLKFAEAHFAVYHLLLNAGLRIRRSGLVKKEQESGTSVQNNAVQEFYTPEEIETLRDQFYAAAIDSANPFKPAAMNRPKNTSVTIGGGWA